MKRLLFLTMLAGALTLAVAGGGDDDGTSNGGPTATGTSAGGPSTAGEPGPDSPTVSMSGTTIAAGETGEAVLAVLNVGAPGLGAWTVDIKYDPDAVTIVECEPQSEFAVCNAAFAGDVARITGATAIGLEGDTVIGRLSFECVAAGESELTLSVETLADGTIGDPQLLAAHVENGAIACEG